MHSSSASHLPPAGSPAVHVSRGPGDTEALGERLGRVISRGQIIALTGDLGAGKTQFVKGLARGLGCGGRVHSPTFTLVNEYSGGRLTLFHLDLYRLETPSQVLSAGIEEFLAPDGASVIEWAERLPETEWKTGKVKRVNIEIITDTERKITYDDFGA